MIAQYITKGEVTAYEAKGWNVVQFGGHHGRFYLAWREDD